MRLQPKSLKARAFVPELGLALSSAFLDHKIHGRALNGNRLTASTINNPDGTVARRILIGKSLSSRSVLRVMTAQRYAEYPAAVSWRARRVSQ